VNLVRLCKQTYDLCLPFDLARLYVYFSFCNDDLSWIKMIKLDVLLNVGFNENLWAAMVYICTWLMNNVTCYGCLLGMKSS
jgi:hypothetical protein